MEEQREILEAVEKISASPELRDEASSDPEGLLDRLNLKGIARQAVAVSITVLLVGGAHVKPDSWWGS